MNHLKTWGIFPAIVLIALALRIHVAQNVPVEVDEDNYLSAALDYRRGLDARSLHQVTHVKRNYEHPPLVKFLYALTMDQEEVDSLPPKLYPGFMEKLPNSLDRARGQAIFAGVLSALMVALINPFAGLVMAAQSMQVYYTGVAYLDALPVLFISLMAWAYTRQPPENRRVNPYFWLSAVFFGAAVAAKYPYALVGLVLIVHALFYRLHSLPKLILWGLISIFIFFWLNPYLWPDPIGRLESQLTFHTDYGLGRNYSLLAPWGQMIYPRQDIRYDEGLMLHPIVDIFFFLLAVAGTYLLLRQKSLFGWWLVAGMIFQMLWPAQWIQHNMIMIVPYSISAASAFHWLVQKRLQPRVADS
ncbi:MAG: hypothetical protein K8I82_31010 [Anaerolineae bacterium]|nr:hypothetical protein [Anaerolineae bacterium]